MELVIETGGVNFGEVWGTISIIGLTSDGVHSFGRISTLDDDCENPSGGKGAKRSKLPFIQSQNRFFIGEPFVSHALRGRNGNQREIGSDSCRKRRTGTITSG